MKPQEGGNTKLKIGGDNRTMKNVLRRIAWLGIVAFVVLALNETVFCRAATENYNYSYQPFWSYEAIMNGKKYLIKEHYLNVAFFIPLGMLVWVMLKKKQWWRALAFGCAVSSLIEVLQLVLKRGMCEFDDVMHNSLGCMIGYGLVKVLASLRRQSIVRAKG